VSFSTKPPRRQALHKTGLWIALLGLSLTTSAALAKEHSPYLSEPTTQIGTVALTELPPEAQKTHLLIRTGGPFSHAKDGSVFGNRERILPRKPRGHYREYTVPTPNARDRGARRIVCAGNPPANPESCFYTADHYSTFQRIVP
jgi:ribonuclease T1